MIVRTPNSRPASRRGFTLVEMLTVIVIISILAAMTLGGAFAVRNSVRRSIIVADIKQLETGLQTYKTEVGELPPDFAFCDLPAPDPRGIAARARVVNHLRKRFPKLRLTGANTELQFASFLDIVPDGKIGGAVATVGTAANDLNPSTALTFWLGGKIIDGVPKGFHEDPTNPFKSGEPRTKVYVQIKADRLNGLQYVEPGITPPSPYVYFRAVKDNATGRFEYGAAAGAAFTPYKYGTGSDVCVPYLEDASADPPVDPVNDQRVWRNPEEYQIIAAGLDGKFSTGTPSDFRYSKVGKDLTDGDFDNLASFTKGELQKEL